MNLTYSLCFMFIASFIIQYFFMSLIMVDDFIHITHNIGKAYLAGIMAVSMMIIEVLMHDHQYHSLSYKLYIIFAVLLAGLICVYRFQVGIDDNQYVKGMIEHHSMALFTSKEMVAKTNNYNVAKLAKNIIQTQTDELSEMREILNKKERNL